jgi:hypothetical protein
MESTWRWSGRSLARFAAPGKAWKRRIPARTGYGQKASDLDAIPLCRRHHRTGADSLHALGPARFAWLHGLDVPGLIAELRILFGVTV